MVGRTGDASPVSPAVATPLLAVLLFPSVTVNFDL